MAEFQSIPIDNDFRIEVLPGTPKLNLTDADQKKIDLIWKNESEMRPDHLFNGLILNVVEYDSTRIVGFFVEYKYLLAQHRDPLLKEILHITPVCVSAVTRAGDHVLIGRRTHYVTQYKNSYECVPSGGIDPQAVQEGKADIKTQLVNELQEEAGLTNPLSSRIFAIVHDPNESIFEICGEIHLPPKAAARSPVPNAEYSHFDWVKNEHLAQFCTHPTRTFVPISLWMLRTLQLL